MSSSFQIMDQSILEDAVHDIAADGSTRTEDGSVAHLLAELLPVLFQLAGRSTGLRARRLGYLKWHVTVVGG